MKGLFGGVAEDLEHQRDLIGFAAQAQHQDRSEVRMARVAPDGPLQHAEGFVIGADAAAGPVHDGYDTVDIRIVVQKPEPFDFARDLLCRGRRAVHRGDDADIVSRADPAVLAPVALERGALRLGHHVRLLHRLAEVVVAIELSHGDVVHVHMLTGGDVGGGEPDDLSILDHGLALLDRHDGHLVPAGKRLSRGDGHRFRDVALGDIGQDDGNVILVTELDGLVGRHLFSPHCVQAVDRKRASPGPAIQESAATIRNARQSARYQD